MSEQTYNPHTRGVRLNSKSAGSRAGHFGTKQLREITQAISDVPEDNLMLLESCTVDDIDLHVHGDNSVLLHDAVTAVYAKLEPRMKALQRAINAPLPEALKSTEAPIVGQVRKAGSFATLTVQFPMGDGQAVSVIFHAPDDDPTKFTAGDTLIAFSWMLNKRDITAVVAPITRTRDVSLVEVARRVSDLVAANSERFKANGAKRAEQQKEMEAVATELEKEKANHAALVTEVDNLDARVSELDGEIETVADQVKAQEEENQDLRDRLHSLQAKKAKVTGLAQERARREKAAKDEAEKQEKAEREIELAHIDSVKQSFAEAGVKEEEFIELVALLAQVEAMKGSDNVVSMEARRLKLQAEDMLDDLRDRLHQAGLSIDTSELAAKADEWARNSAVIAKEVADLAAKAAQEGEAGNAVESRVWERSAEEIKSWDDYIYAAAYHALQVAQHQTEAVLLKAKRFGDEQDVAVLQQRIISNQKFGRTGADNPQIQSINDKLSLLAGKEIRLVEIAGEVKRLELEIEQEKSISPIPNRFRGEAIDQLKSEEARLKYGVDTKEISEEDLKLYRETDYGYTGEEFSKRYGWNSMAGHLFSKRVEARIAELRQEEWESSDAFKLGIEIFSSLEEKGFDRPSEEGSRYGGRMLASGRWGGGEISMGFPSPDGDGFSMDVHYSEDGRGRSRDGSDKLTGTAEDIKAGVNEFLAKHETLVKSHLAPKHGSKDLPEGVERTTPSYRKQIRADIKAAIKSGLLPAGLKTAVNGRRDNVSIEIRELPSAVTLYNPEFIEWNSENEHASYLNAPSQYTREFKSLEKTLEAIAEAYQTISGTYDPYADYPSSSIYKNIEIDVSPSGDLKNTQRELALNPSESDQSPDSSPSIGAISVEDGPKGSVEYSRLVDGVPTKIAVAKSGSGWIVVNGNISSADGMYTSALVEGEWSKKDARSIAQALSESIVSYDSNTKTIEFIDDADRVASKALTGGAEWMMPYQYKKPTVTSLGLNVMKGAQRWRKGTDGDGVTWYTNGHVLDSALPKVRDANDLINEEASFLRGVPRILSNAKASAQQELKIVSVKKQASNQVVILEGESGIAAIDKRYLDYFVMQYKNATFHGSSSEHDGSTPVLVKSGGAVVGVVMPVGVNGLIAKGDAAKKLEETGPQDTDPVIDSDPSPGKTDDTQGAKPDRMTWEREIMDRLIEMLEIPNGDAQGVVEANGFEVAQEWAKGSTSEEAAARIASLGEPIDSDNGSDASGDSETELSRAVGRLQAIRDRAPGAAMDSSADLENELDSAASIIEQADAMDEYEPLLQEVADMLTELIRSENEG